MPAGTHGALKLNWWGATAPPTLVALGARSYVGQQFAVSAAGRLCGFRYYGANAQPQDFWALFWDQTNGKLLRAVAFSEAGSNAAGWQQVWFHPFYRLSASLTYRLAIEYPATGYYRQNTALAAGFVTHSGIQYQNGFQSTAINPVAAAITLNTNANGVDVLYLPG